jgi:hypothetical protein
MQVTFRQVMARTGALLAVRWQSVFVGVLSFALLAAALSAFVNSRIQRVEDRVASDLGMTWETLDDTVSFKLATLTQTGAMSVAMQMDKLGWNASVGAILKNVPDQGDAAMMAYLIGIGPWIFLCAGGIVLIGIVCTVFFLLLATSGMSSAYDVAQRLPWMVVRMFVLALWLSVRSFIWVPVVGPLIAIYVLPRLSLAPVLLASGECGIMECQRESFARSKGHWWSIAFILIGIGFLISLMLWGSLVVTSVAVLFSMKLGLLLWYLALMYAAAVFATSLTMLTVSLG